MTDHRAEAERCLELIAGPEGTLAEKQALIGIAQVHATLAAIPAPRKLSLEEMDAQLSEHVRARFMALQQLTVAVQDYIDHVEDGAKFARLVELVR